VDAGGKRGGVIPGEAFDAGDLGGRQFDREMAGGQGWPPLVSSFRAAVERAIGASKTWRILFSDYRRPLKTFMSSFCASIGLYFSRGFCIFLNVRCYSRSSTYLRAW
jgi:hypothetical protein